MCCINVKIFGLLEAIEGYIDVIELAEVYTWDKLLEFLIFLFFNLVKN